MRRSELPARFVTFEGGEGAGKSTQITMLSNFLNSISIQHIVTREPGGSPGGEEIRKLLVEGKPSRWDPETETLLHFAARRDHLVRTIKPTLEKGCWVLCDRHVDSTIAYQGYGHGVPLKMVNEVYKFIDDQLHPDLTFVLDLPADEGLERTLGRAEISVKDDQENRYEKMNLEFHERLRLGFLEIARSDPSRCKVIDASPLSNKVFEEIKNVIRARYLDEKDEA